MGDPLSIFVVFCGRLCRVLVPKNRKKLDANKVCARLEIELGSNLKSEREQCTAAEEQRTFQVQHGEKYIQLKTYTDQLEAELRETKSKMQALTGSNDELREVKSDHALYVLGLKKLIQ